MDPQQKSEGTPFGTWDADRLLMLTESGHRGFAKAAASAAIAVSATNRKVSAQWEAPLWISRT